MDGPEHLLAATAEVDVAGAVGPWPLAMPAFFVGWAVLGVALTFAAHRRGHDPLALLGTGAGLGPLAVLLLADARRLAASRPRLHARAVDHGGPLDVVVLVDADGDVGSISSTLHAVAPDLGTVTVARRSTQRCPAPADEAAVLARWRDALPVDGVGEVAGAGWTPARARHHLRRPRRALLVLVADAHAASARGGARRGGIG